MPELPEVETLRRELAARLKGRRILNVEVRLPKLVAMGPVVLSPTRRHSTDLARRFERSLAGRTILNVGRRGKMLLFTLGGNYSLLVHLKLAGQILVTKPGQKSLVIRLFNTPTAEPEELPSKHTHVIMELSGRVRLFYNDLRRFGTWRLIANRELEKVPDLLEQGPDAVDPPLTVERLQGQLGTRPNRSIKEALTDQTVLAGVGNIYADEALFRAKLHPPQPVRDLRPQDWRKLLRATTTVLREAIAFHGSSVGDFLRTDGRWGEFGKRHRVYRRTGQPCRVCGTTIRRIVLAGRGTHFCPHCQELRRTKR